MTEFHIPWAAWYGSEPLTLRFPTGWEVSVCRMRGGDDIGDAGIRKALAEPIGAPPLRDFAAGRHSAAILVDDLSRPTPAFRVLPYILEELHAAGIEDDGITIIAALAAHRPMVRDDFVKKLGTEIVERYRVVNHNAYENLEFLGYSSLGVPVFVNRELMGCQVRIAAGMITPRGEMFGGGAKLLIPGACGQQTIMLNHRHVNGEPFRPHLDEVARMAGLGYIVNPLLNEQLEITDLVAGDVTAAFERGCELGAQRYATPMPAAGSIDVGVFNAFPKDTELVQAGLALVPLNSCAHDPFTDNGTIVIASASPEGLGWHSVLGPGTALRGEARPQQRRTFLFSPGVNEYDCRALYGDHVSWFRHWDELIERLTAIHGSQAKAALFPAGALQMAQQ
jgi:nickel-dependent lactate racemase